MMAMAPPQQSPPAGKSGAPQPRQAGAASPSATSKANERGDKTMDQVRQGGSSAMGSGGNNQY